MRRLWTMALAGAMPALACAQGLEVSGRVVDAVSGAPLVRASVSLETITVSGAPGTYGAGVEATTGADGSFRFLGLAAGRYRLSGSRRGYITTAYQEHDGYFAAMIVGAGVPGATGVRLRLEPFGSITGEVRDGSGDPVETASLTLFAPATDGSGKIVPRQTRFLFSNSPRFDFDKLPAGTYFIAVTARPWFAQPAPDGTSSPLDVAYPLTFYNGAESAAAAEPIGLKAGEAATVNISLHAVPAVHVEVPQQSTSNFQIPLLGQSAFGSSVPVNMGGWNSLRLPAPAGKQPSLVASIAPGSYTVQRGTGSSTLDVRGDVTLESAEAAPAPVALSGKLAMADGRPLPAELSLRLLPAADGSVRSRRGTQRFAGFGQRPVEIAVGADGSFHTDSAPPGEYRLAISGAGSSAWAVTGAAATGAEVGEDSRLHVGADPVMLAATVARADGVVSGQVAGGESGVMVLVAPQAGSAALGQQDESDSDGTWTVRGLTPGRYWIMAIRDGWDLGWKRPGALARYQQRAMPVTVPAGGSVTVPEQIAAQAR